MSQQVNLFNPVFRPRGFSFTSAQALLYAVGILTGVIAAAAVWSDYALRQVAASAQATDSAHRALTEQLAQLTNEVAQQKPSAQIEADIAALEAQLKGRQEIVDTLRSGAVGNTAGFSEYMRALSRQTINGLWLTGFDIDGNDLVIHGRSFNSELVANFLRQLNREPVLQGREISAMRIRQPPQEPVEAPPAKAEADKAQKDVREARPAPPRYLEFSLSTVPLPEETQRPVARAVAAPVAVTQPLAGAGNTVAIDTNRVIDAVKLNLQQGAAK